MGKSVADSDDAEAAFESGDARDQGRAAFESGDARDQGRAAFEQGNDLIERGDVDGAEQDADLADERAGAVR